MKIENKELISQSIAKFHLPRYKEIPDVGLFLEQVTKYINEYLKPLDDISLTGSMISNYVKMKLIDNPIKKQYGRDQIAHLFFIALFKPVLTLDEINKLLIIADNSEKDIEDVYNNCCDEFEKVLFFVFGLRDVLEETVKDRDDLLHFRYVSITVANRSYLSKCFKEI